jgi:pimeloyl-ACP methyl ester carboxylesterase
MALLPLGVPQWLIQGGDDSIVSAESAHAYAAAAARAGDRISLLEQPGSGHFESVVPAGAAWQALLAAVSAALR